MDRFWTILLIFGASLAAGAIAKDLAVGLAAFLILGLWFRRSVLWYRTPKHPRIYADRGEDFYRALHKAEKKRAN